MKSVLKEIYEFKLNQVFLNKDRISQKELIKKIESSEKTRGFFKKVVNNVKNM